MGCSDKKNIRVWRRESGEEIFNSLCDKGEDEYDSDSEDEIDDDDFFHPLSMASPGGNILFTSSRKGGLLCIWNIEEGAVGERWDDALQHVDVLPDGFDVTDMVYLEHLNAFLFVCTGFMYIWSFPTSKRQSDMATSIRRREILLRKALWDPDPGGSGSDEDPWPLSDLI